ncbi:MAG: glycosyltransferase family 4 protein [Paludibacteraceae bacterium]|nr:glycosyltransferase family 4 protein [Paludibacteraceae bacterium]
MKKALFYGDFLKPTGFGNVMENIIERMMGHLDIEVIGINHDGSPYNVKDSQYYKFKDIPVYPAQCNGDMFGYGKLLGKLIKGNYDVLFILQDLFNILPVIDELKAIREKKGFKIVMYFPIDGKPKDEWKRIIDVVDYPVTYTNWGKEQIAKPVKVVYHGVDKEFKPLSLDEKKEFKRHYFNTDSYIITNVNRNQPRKDLPRTIASFDLFNKAVPDSMLYLHCNWKDHAGVDLEDFIKTNYPHLRFNIIKPECCVDKNLLNKIYNASDLIVSTTLGEGWGLSTIEAMACGTPVLIPDNTTAKEIVGDDRGFLAKSGADESMWVSNLLDNNIMRPITDVVDMYEEMLFIYNNPQEALRRAENALDWVQENCNWDKICLQWREIIC